MTSIVKIENLSHRYTRDWAIKDINIHIDQPGIVGLLGSNGAGKSTTMDILCGIISATQGTASISGYDIRKEPIEAKKMLGFLPQKAPLYGNFTVDEYLHHAARLRSIPKDEIKPAMDRVKEYTGIAHYSKRLISNLSGGYQQRVGIAQSIIHSPKLVVLDEPTNGLDPVQITEVRSLIRDISRESTVLLSTHILQEVQILCERIIMVEKGEIVFDGGMQQFNDEVISNALIARFANQPLTENLLREKDIEEVEILTDGSYKITTHNPKSTAQQLMQASKDKGWDMYEIYLQKASLDEVFAKLSNQKLKV